MKREKSAMYGWDADEEHSIARPSRRTERGRDSWSEESEDHTISRPAKGKRPATTAALGTTSTDVSATEGRCGHGNDLEEARDDSSVALADRGAAVPRQALEPHELPGPRERQEKGQPANEHGSNTSDDLVETALVC